MSVRSREGYGLWVMELSLIWDWRSIMMKIITCAAAIPIANILQGSKASHPRTHQAYYPVSVPLLFIYYIDIV